MDWEAGANAVYAKHEDHRSLERDVLRKVFDQYIQGGLVGEFHTFTDFIEKTQPALKITIEEFNEIFKEANAAMYVRPAMIAYIEELKKNYKIGLLSNFTSGLEQRLQEVFSIYHLFDVVVSSYNLKIKKPDPLIYQYTLEKLGVPAHEAVFIDDWEENVKGAEHLGIKGIIFKSVEQCKTDLDNLLLS